MKNWATAFDNVSGTFPSITAINVSTPGAGDGTEFIADLINDTWGWMQALMNRASQTPSGTVESYGVSQIIQAMHRNFAAPGEVVLWHGNSDPAVDGLRLILLQGQGIVRANYVELDNACYVGDTNNATFPAYYRATDSAGTTRSTTGAYLILPDMRGLVPRGNDPTNENDPLGSTREFPDSQSHAIEEHLHNIISTNPGYRPVDRDAADSGTGTPMITIEAGTEVSTNLVAAKTPLYSCNFDAYETRMANFQVKYCVRY